MDLLFINNLLVLHFGSNVVGIGLDIGTIGPNALVSHTLITITPTLTLSTGVQVTLSLPVPVLLTGILGHAII
jgi:hypothetical protein